VAVQKAKYLSIDSSGVGFNNLDRAYTGQISLAPPSFQARALSEPSLSTFAPTQSKGGTVDLINSPLAGVILTRAEFGMIET
jgi:hypothetical protein